MQVLDGKLVLITGAASGIGRATAHAFAAAGSRLILVDVDEVGLQSLAAELGAWCVMTRQVDVSDRDAMAALAKDVHELAPAVDVVVNNAGVAFAGGLLDTPLDQWDWVLGVNLRGVIHGCHFFAPAMVARGQGGHLVNVASVFGIYGAPGVAAYAASKFAVRGMSQSLRAELAPHGIGVSTICPGMIATNIVQSARTPDGQQDSIRRAINVFRTRGAKPSLAANAIVSAVRHNRAEVPVARDGWAIWGLARAAPTLLERLGQRALRKLS